MKTIISTVVALLALAGPLKATLWTTPVSSSVTLNSSTFSTLNLAKFDTSLGTLVSVNLQYGISFSGTSVTLNNTSGGSVDGAAHLITGFTRLNPGTFNFGNIPAYLDGSTDTKFDLDVSQAYIGIPSGSSVTWTPGVISANVSDNITSSLTGYQGAGTFSASLKETFYETASFSGGGNSFTGILPNGLFFGSVSYEYISAVPEPGTWISGSMLLIFVGGTVGRSYWRRVKAKA